MAKAKLERITVQEAVPEKVIAAVPAVTEQVVTVSMSVEQAARILTILGKMAGGQAEGRKDVNTGGVYDALTSITEVRNCRRDNGYELYTLSHRRAASVALVATYGTLKQQTDNVYETGTLVIVDKNGYR